MKFGFSIRITIEVRMNFTKGSYIWNPSSQIASVGQPQLSDSLSLEAPAVRFPQYGSPNNQIPSVWHHQQSDCLSLVAPAVSFLQSDSPSSQILSVRQPSVLSFMQA